MKALERQLNIHSKDHQTAATLPTFIRKLVLLTLAALFIRTIQILLPNLIDGEHRATSSNSSSPSVRQDQTPIREDETPQHKLDIEKEQIKYIISLIANNLAKLSTGRTFVAEPTLFPEKLLRFKGQNITNFLREYVKRVNFYK